jgi:hypothetical protein
MFSDAACATAGIVHPNGGLASLATLFMAMVLSDRQRLNLRFFCLMCVPYLVLALPWALYIYQAPELFEAQFIGNAKLRLLGNQGGQTFGTRFCSSERVCKAVEKAPQPRSPSQLDEYV